MINLLSWFPKAKICSRSLCKLVMVLNKTDYTGELSNLTKAGMPPDLKMVSKPCLCMERLWRVPTAPLVDSRSLVLVIAFTRAPTILWLFLMVLDELS